MRFFRSFAAGVAILALGTGGIGTAALAAPTTSPAASESALASVGIDTEWTEAIAPNYYKVLGKSAAPNDFFKGLAKGETRYCDLDAKGRSICAGGLLTHTTERDEGSLPNPSGWPASGVNKIVTIPSANGGKDYHGYFWNRSHMLAASLDGTNKVNNLVTGTRTQNVGNNDNQGGMAYTEIIARDYLKSGKGDSCPLYYVATPVYKDDELIPRGVVVNMKSCDKGDGTAPEIDTQVLTYNDAKGYTINYNNGEFQEEGDLIEVVPIPPVLIPAEKCGELPTVQPPASVEGVSKASSLIIGPEGETIITWTVSPKPGYKFPDGTQTSWGFVLTPKVCPGEATPVVPNAPVLVPAAKCGVEATVKIPDTEGVEYISKQDTTVKDKVIVTITAKAKEGYTIATGATSSWTFDLTATPCGEGPEENILVTPKAPTFVPPAKPGEEGTVTIPKVVGVRYSSEIISEPQRSTPTTPVLLVKATPEKGYEFTKGSTTSWRFYLRSTDGTKETAIYTGGEEPGETEDLVATPVAPVLTPSEKCGVAATVAYPSSGLAPIKGLSYSSSSKTLNGKNLVTIVAQAEKGYVLPQGSVSSWELDVTAEPCAVDSKTEEEAAKGETSTKVGETSAKVEKTGVSSMSLPLIVAGVSLVIGFGAAIIGFRKPALAKSSNPSSKRSV